MQDPQRAPDRRRGHKRADGEGAISPHHKGGWRGRLMIGYQPNGKPDIREVYGKTQADCRHKLQALRQQHAQQALPKRAARRDTLAAYVERWLGAVEASVRPTTFRRYASLLRGHVLPTLGGVALSGLRPDDVQCLYAALLIIETTRGHGRSAAKPLQPGAARRVGDAHRGGATAARRRSRCNSRRAPCTTCTWSCTRRSSRPCAGASSRATSATS